MGVLSWLFGRRNRYEDLDENSVAALRLRDLGLALHVLVAKAPAPVEIIPGEGCAFAFVGKPPSEFHFFWVVGAKVRSLGQLAEELGLNPGTERTLQAALAQAYERSSRAPRYRARIAGRKVLVVPWPQLAIEIHSILDRAAHAGQEHGAEGRDPDINSPPFGYANES